ncbi:hypothetical protein LOD99_12331 [Oopsacas minuta]|uniref:Uncharacterized protein n=1 Tax=Oopsacas minuta TaxID=111878 RepID=A0AAV7JF25_9METZ|nr:hypothetical protein LOD99_12331 [Oopsacas minuta]
MRVSSGDSIVVEKIEAVIPSTSPPPSRALFNPISDRQTEDIPRNISRATEALSQLNGMRSDSKIDMYDSAAEHREHFQKGGIYYNTFMKMFDNDPSDNHHFQFYLMPRKTFSYSREADEFVLCLDGVHIYVQPITDKLKETIEKKKKEAMNWGSEFGSSLDHSFSNALRQQPKIEAFVGAGTRLGTGEQEPVQQPRSHSYNPLQDPLIETILQLANSSSALSSSTLPQQMNEEDPDSIVHSKYPDDDNMSTSD